MLLDVLALGVLIYFVVAGILGGALVSFLRIFSLVGAYVAAFTLGPILAPLLELSFQLSRLSALVTAGTVLFFAVFAICNTCMWLAKRAQKREDAPKRSRLDRALGGGIGAIQGAVFALLIGVLANFVEVGQQKGALEGFPAGGKTVGAATAVVLENTADVVFDEDAHAARVAFKLAARPAAAVEGFEQIVQSPVMKELQGDTLFWSYLEHGSIDQALNQRTFLQVTYNEELRTRMAELGMISSRCAQDPKQFRAEARSLFEELSPRIRVIRQDPVIAEMAQDPDVVEAIRTGNSLALLSDPRFQEVASRVLNAAPDPALAASDPAL